MISGNLLTSYTSFIVYTSVLVCAKWHLTAHLYQFEDFLTLEASYH